MYLSLLAIGNRQLTQEASIGALQNLTAGNRGVKSAIFILFLFYLFFVCFVCPEDPECSMIYFIFFPPFAHHVKEVTSLHKQNTCKCSGCSGVYQNAHLDKIITLYVFQDTIRIKLRIREDKRFGSVLCCYSADYF